MDKIKVPNPALVKLKAPLMTPPKVMEPVPPIVLLLPKTMALLRTMLVPVAVKVPLLPTPAPLMVKVLLLPKVALLKLKSRVAPEVILIALVAFKLLAEPALKVPALMLVLPE